MNQKQQALSTNGYCVIPDVLDSAMLQSLRTRFSDVSLAGTPKANFGDAGAFMVADYHDPLLVRLLTWPKSLEILAGLGFPEPKLHNFYVSTKPPRAKALAWHSDLFYKYGKPEPAELFLIYYLQDTAPQNGCLRVVPGSQRWSHTKRHSQPEDAARRDDEVDVPVAAGSLFIGDRRILHATHPNASDTWRTCLTIAYAPLFASLPEPVKARIVQNQCLPRPGWSKQPAEIDPRLRRILPIYEGEAAPIVVE
jgi:ectoine hydroxylase-related dioxygenase (phytanoyl-CoA dioxygenase family)